MMKKKNQVLVSLSIVALLGGCSEEQVQRDVYNSLEDCLADWQKIELCEADQSNENNSGTTAHAGSGSSLSCDLFPLRCLNCQNELHHQYLRFV